MRISKLFVTHFLIMLALNLVDIHSTHFYTPTLEFESNPIVRYLGLSWPNLYLVLFASLILNAFFVYYSTDIFHYPAKPNDISVNFLNALRSFFIGSANDLKSIVHQIIKSSFFFFGIIIFWKYCIEKILAIFYNYTIGYFLKYSSIQGLSKNGFLDVNVDPNLPVWQTLHGKFIFWYATLNPETRLNFDGLLIKTAIIICFLYLIKAIIKYYLKPAEQVI